MALITCPECKKKVSETVNSCPNCGYQFKAEETAEIKKKEQQQQKYLGIGCLFAIFILIIIWQVYFSSDNSKTPPSKTHQINSPIKWYEGGTLHKAKMREWSQASYKNKLATAADLVMGLLKIDGVVVMNIDIERELKPKAIDFVKGLDAANEDGTADSLAVAEVAATIWVMMKN